MPTKPRRPEVEIGIRLLCRMMAQALRKRMTEKIGDEAALDGQAHMPPKGEMAMAVKRACKVTSHPPPAGKKKARRKLP